MKPILRRQKAADDIGPACQYYLDEGATAAALGFIDALETAFEGISRHPSAGSPRYAVELGIANLRSRPVRGYAFAIFYLDLEDRVEIVRVLHLKRDIPENLRE